MTVTARRGRRVAIGASWGVFLLCLFTGLTGAAHADDPTPQLSLRAVDSTDPAHTKLTVHWSGDASKVQDLAINEDGQSVDVAKPTSSQDAGVRNNVVFVIDTSDSASQSGLVNAAQKAVVSMANTIHKADPNARFALVSAGLRDELQLNLSGDTKALASAGAGLSTGGDGAVWDGVGRAARILQRTDADSIRNIVLITDGQIDGAGVSSDQLLDDKTRDLGSVQEAGATVSIIGSGDIGVLSQLASDTGGMALGAGSADQVAAQADQMVAGVTGYYVTEYSSNVDAGVADLSMNVDGVTAQNSFVVGSFVRNASDLAAVKGHDNSTGIVALQGTIGKLMAIVLAAAACLLLALGVFLLVTRESGNLDSMLQVYDDSFNAANGEDPVARSQVAIVQRAVDMTEQIAARQGLITKYEEKLERADVPLRPAEYLLIAAFSTVAAMLVVLFVTHNPLLALGMLLPGLLLPGAVLNFIGGRRRKKFEALLPDMLQLLSGTLKAGYSMMQGVEAVASEVPEPMGKELRRVMTEARLGRPLEEALDAVAERMGSKDFGWAVMAIRIQREVGGNLSELLMTVSTTMVQRERLRRDVNSLTAEGRVSAYMLGLMPPTLMIAMEVMNPSYMRPLFEERTGNIILGAGTLMIVGGFLWMNKLVKVEV